MRDCYLERLGVLSDLAVRLVVEHGVPKDEREVGICVERVFVSILFDTRADVVQTPGLWDELVAVMGRVVDGIWVGGAPRSIGANRCGRRAP